MRDLATEMTLSHTRSDLRARARDIYVRWAEMDMLCTIGLIAWPAQDATAAKTTRVTKQH